MSHDFLVYVGPYLSGTQFLIFLFRVMGARIGYDVILPHIGCLTDPHLVTIGDHVRLNMGAYIQVRYGSIVPSSIFYICFYFISSVTHSNNVCSNWLPSL